jgi:hypothetical protein
VFSTTLEQTGMSHVLRKRPRIVSIFCVSQFIFCAGQIITISAPSIRNIAIWYPIIYGMIVSLRFISLVGVWHMKKWGAELFVYATIVKIITQVLVGDLTTMAKSDAVYSVILCIVFMTFYKRMSRNL